MKELTDRQMRLVAGQLSILMEQHGAVTPEQQAEVLATTMVAVITAGAVNKIAARKLVKQMSTLMLHSINRSYDDYVAMMDRVMEPPPGGWPQ